MRRVPPAALLPGPSAIVGAMPLVHAIVMEPLALRSAVRLATMGSYAPKTIPLAATVQLEATATRAVRLDVPVPPRPTAHHERRMASARAAATSPRLIRAACVPRQKKTVAVTVSV